MKRHTLLLLSFILLSFFLEGCATYKRCQEKFAVTRTDTTIVEVPVLVPRDSVALRLVTDTTYLYKEVQQGRARLTFERTPRETRIKAECDTVTIIKRVPVATTINQWGVDPIYKKLAWGFGLLWLATMLFLLFAHYFHINIEKRT